MSLPSSIVPLKTLAESQRVALLKLLADEDPAIYRAVRAKIVSYGPQATGWLRPHALSNDPLLRRRAQAIIQFFAKVAADEGFLAFCQTQTDNLDLEEGVFRLAQTEYPEINAAGYSALLDNYAGELMTRIDFGADVESILATLNQYLFQHLGFSGNEEDFYSPDNSYLNRVIERRKGNPITLSVLYLLVARRLHLPVVGIGMPGHFLCRFQSATTEIYINVFNRGKLLTRADCTKFLHKNGYGFQDDFLGPVSSRRILLRICKNLHRIYSDEKMDPERSRSERYVAALEK